MECLAFNSARKQSWITAYNGGVAVFYTGIKPSAPEKAENENGDATAVVTITLNGKAHTAGIETNGITYIVDADGKVCVDPNSVFMGTAVASGDATWVRVYDKNHVVGESDTAVRRDFSITKTTIAVGDIVKLSDLKISFPRRI